MTGFIESSSRVLRLAAIAVLLLFLTNPSFGQTNDSFHVPASGPISGFAVEPDGKIIVGGNFATLGGQNCNHIGRLNSDGTVDVAFNPGDSNTVNAIAIQPDGKIIAARNSRVFQVPSTNVVRYNPDGTLDPSFHGVLADDNVECVALQPDGKILVGGVFTTLGGQPRACLGRLNTNGTLDSGFHVLISESSGGFPRTLPEVASIAVQPDIGILIGGTFTSVAASPRTNICRLNANGTLDGSFMSPPQDKQYPVQCLTLQPDGKILASFSMLGNFFIGPSGTNYLRRMNSDGSLDSGFAPGFDAAVSSLSVQTDGKILASGSFTRCNGSARTNLTRLNSDGTLDTGFNARIGYSGVSLGSTIVDSTMAQQNDGKLLLGANLGRATPPTNYVARYSNTDPAADSLSFDGSTIIWLRDGTAPEVWRTTFDTCTNGADWVSLGEGARINGGWQLAGLSLPTDTPIRARGFLTGGANNGSSWYVESTLNLTQPPKIIADDSAFGIHSNQFSFNIAAIPDQIVIVEASSDLQNWTPLATNTLYSNPLHFSDPSSAQIPSRFYRARLQ
jgi:uncharacterized delta-60 repeat protein